jgi:hypothetical protein
MAGAPEVASWVVDFDPGAAANVAGNARLTAGIGAAIFVLLVVEGLTVLEVERFMWLHAFIGTLLVSFVVAKIATTGYRFTRYYRGQPDYVKKGPPPTVLRVLGPAVTITTVLVLATGIGTLLARDIQWLQIAHKGTFVLWFGAMTIHVLGHALETPALAFADWRRSQRMVPGAPARRILLVALLLVGAALALATRGWAHDWQHLTGY